MMKTFRAAWCAAVMAAWISGPIVAAPPTPGKSAAPTSGKGAAPTVAAAPDAPPEPGVAPPPPKADAQEPQHFLLLSNGGVLSGRIEKQNDIYLVRRVGGAIPVPVDQALHIADSIEKIYQFRVQRIAVGDISEHASLSDWCMTHKLFDQAEAELLHVLRIDPTNRVAQRRLDFIRRGRQPAERASATAASQPRTRTQTIAADPAAYLVGFTQAHGRKAFERFSVLEKRLLNECGKCHASSQYTGTFRLFRRNPGEPLDQRRTARNLQAMLRNIDFEDPTQSAVLAMALNPHGSARLPSYAGPNDPHFKDLSDWVHEIASSSRSAVIAVDSRESADDRMASDGESTPAEPTGRPADRAAKGGLLAGSDVSRRGAAAPAADDDPETGAGTAPAPANRSAKPRKLRDPYDPAAFNDQFAPAGKSKKP